MGTFRLLRDLADRLGLVSAEVFAGTGIDMVRESLVVSTKPSPCIRPPVEFVD